MCVRSPSARAQARSVVTLLLAAVVGAAACSEDAGNTQGFCAELEANLDEVVRPEISSGADADAQVRLYRRLAEEAPLAIEEDWGALVDARQAAYEVVAGDPESEQRAAAAAYAAERSAVAVATWARTNCGVELGPVVTVGDVPPPTTTTVPATTSSASPTTTP